MKKIILTIVAYFILTITFGQSSFDGTFVGLDPICWTLKNGKTECYSDPARPKRKWYHLTYLKIKGDSVFADQNPINIYKRDTLYSSSDGAFYYYHGTINQKDSIATIKMQLIYCDYCAVPTKDNPMLIYLLIWLWFLSSTFVILLGIGCRLTFFKFRHIANASTLCVMLGDIANLKQNRITTTKK